MSKSGFRAFGIGVAIGSLLIAQRTLGRKADHDRGTDIEPGRAVS